MEDGECVEHDTVPLIPPGRGFGALSGPGHQYDLLNKGCYGANLEYIGSLKNTSTTNTETGYAYLAMVARNVSKFFGAAEVALPDPVAGDKRAVPALDPPSGNPARRELVDLLQARAGGRIAVGHGQTKPLKVRVASGGACATPVNLYLSKSLIERQPVGEPG
ncbi:MAG: hypothetical protein IT207_07115 [Fimbriimonadaceae bacterium]|nr:hypothetical protein [Fimbriimonadaceae bacterium]